MSFSWEDQKKKAIATKIRRAITMAKLPISADGTVNDFSILHPNEVKEAQTKKFDTLIKRVTEEMTKKQVEAMRRRSKIAGK